MSSICGPHLWSLILLHPTRWCPPSDGTLVYNPHEYYRYNPLINPSEIGLICTNLANELGHPSQYIPIIIPMALSAPLHWMIIIFTAIAVSMAIDFWVSP